jgi:uncharacterized membrane protein YhaH (DUF805 family)
MSNSLKLSLSFTIVACFAALCTVAPAMALNPLPLSPEDKVRLANLDLAKDMLILRMVWGLLGSINFGFCGIALACKAKFKPAAWLMASCFSLYSAVIETPCLLNHVWNHRSEMLPGDPFLLQWLVTPLFLIALTYFFPAILAYSRRRHDSMEIALSNSMLGWLPPVWMYLCLRTFSDDPMPQAANVYRRAGRKRPHR